MDSKEFSAGLADLRGVRDDIKGLRRELELAEQDRDRRVRLLGSYDKAKADRLAPAAGMSVAEVVALVPRLGPQAPAVGAVPAPAAPPVAAAPRPVGAVPPDLRRAPGPAAAAGSELAAGVPAPPADGPAGAPVDGEGREHADAAERPPVAEHLAPAAGPLAAAVRPRSHRSARPCPWCRPRAGSRVSCRRSRPGRPATVGGRDGEPCVEAPELHPAVPADGVPGHRHRRPGPP